MIKKRDVILSLKPKYWDMINYHKTKIVEFRRKWVKKGTQINKLWFYITYGNQKLRGIASGITWIKSDLSYIWDKYNKQGGITKKEFDDYFEGLSEGYVIMWKSIERIAIPPRFKWKWWNRPPQNFMYVKDE